MPLAVIHLFIFLSPQAYAAIFRMFRKANTVYASYLAHPIVELIRINPLFLTTTKLSFQITHFAINL
jgi:hypothetical protein